MIRFRSAVIYASFVLAVSAVASIGCKPSETAENPTPAAGEHHEHDGHQHQDGGSQVAQIDASTPQAAMESFLDAVRTGDATVASSMLTTKAQTEMQNAEMHVLPPGSPYAQYSIDNVTFEPEHNGAFVDSTWSDIVDEQTQEQRSYQITWILRQENNAWRIAGMSTALFPNQPPLVLNFEDPADMQAQVQQANAEMIRQQGGEGEIRQATLPPDSTVPPQR